MGGGVKRATTTAENIRLALGFAHGKNRKM
jgi:hypothetical protein